MTSIPNSVSSSAHFGSTLGISAVVLVVLGVGSAAVGVLPPFGGFLLLVLGLGLALVGTITSLVGVVATSPSKNREGRPAAIRGLLLSLGTIIAIAIPASEGSGVPRINDITTDLGEPPVFVAALTAEANQGRDMAYPGEEFAQQQQEAYPDLAALVVEDAPDVVFDRVHLVLSGMPRMVITGESREDGRIEATETSALFHFSDDVVVRILPYQDGGSRIDVRSKSRDGKGDLGVNAARIREILARVRGGAAAAADGQAATTSGANAGAPDSADASAPTDQAAPAGQAAPATGAAAEGH